MNAPKPRRTAERILDVTLQLFNRFGEPNVSTSQLCGELGISPGNLFYHHASRDALVLALFQRYQAALQDALHTDDETTDDTAPGHAGETTPPGLRALVSLCQSLAGCARQYRFMFRDLNDLVSRHRALEERLPDLLRQQARALEAALEAALGRRPCTGDLVREDPLMVPLWSGCMLSCLTGCAGLDGALDPRELRCTSDEDAVSLATCRAMALLHPALGAEGRSWLQTHLNEGARLGVDPWYLRSAAH